MGYSKCFSNQSLRKRKLHKVTHYANLPRTNFITNTFWLLFILVLSIHCLQTRVLIFTNYFKCFFITSRRLQEDQRDSRGRSLGFIMRLESRFRVSVETEKKVSYSYCRSSNGPYLYMGPINIQACGFLPVYWITVPSLPCSGLILYRSSAFFT